MFALLLLALCSQVSAYLSQSGHGYMSQCANIAMMYSWADTENCNEHLTPNRAKCLMESAIFLQSVSGCARTMADMMDVSAEHLFDDVKGFAEDMRWVKAKASKKDIFAAFQASADYSSWTIAQWGSSPSSPTAEAFPVQSEPVQFAPEQITLLIPQSDMIYDHHVLSRNMGCGILAYWAAIFLIRAVVLFCYRFAPAILKAGDTKASRQIRKYVVLPPLLRFHHASPYRVGRYFTFQLPTRVTSITVVGFVVVNYVLMFVRLEGGRTVVETGVVIEGYDYRLAARAAQLVLYKLPIIFLFCGRNNFLLYFTGWSMNEFSIFHKWCGRVTFIDTIIHAAAATNWSVQLSMYSDWTKHNAQLKWGFAAIALLTLMFLQSIHWLRRLNYELFKYLHMTLSVIFLAVSWQHVVYSYYGRPYMYACWAIWIFDHVMRWSRILVSGFAKANFIYHGGVLEITIEHSNWWQPRGGNHAFIHVLTRDKFWQSHPFSLMRAIKSGEENKLKIIARAKDGITRDWVEKCIKNGGSFQCRVLVDGPYGSRRNFKFFEELVFIAGGIGISSPYAYLQNKVRRDAHQTISLYWGIPNEEPLTWFAHELEYLANSGKFSIHIFIGLDPGDNNSVVAAGDQFLNQFNSDSSLGGTNEKDPFKTSLQGNVHFYSHQMDVPAVIADHIINAAGPTAFLTCGPADMNDTARQAFVQNFEKSRYLCEHFEEHFSW